MSTVIPGIKAKHVFITDNCRVVQGGDLEAFDEAVRRVRAEYEQCVSKHSRGNDVKFHLVLTVDHPRWRGE